MAQKIKKRNKLSDSQLKSEILTLFNAGTSGKMEVFGIIRKQYTCARDRFTKTYDLSYSEWVELKSKAEGDTIIAAATDSLKSGLKSKLEKQLGIQAQVEAIEKEIEQGFWIEIKKVSGREREEKKVLSPTDKAYLRRTLKDLYAELNKMEGDYAPSKTELTGKDGKPLQVQDLASIDYSKLTEEELLTLKKLHDKAANH